MTTAAVVAPQTSGKVRASGVAIRALNGPITSFSNASRSGSVFDSGEEPSIFQPASSAKSPNGLPALPHHRSTLG